MPPTLPLDDPEPTPLAIEVAPLDYFAGLAMAALVGSFKGQLDTSTRQRITDTAYNIADSMIVSGTTPPAQRKGWM